MPDELAFDPTAGERARLNQLLPESPRPILDPTDPRNGSTQPVRRRPAASEARPEAPEPMADRL
jgi:hypothetical protein